VIKRFEHIFFDLDHTLWDFERIAEETKQNLFISLELFRRGIPDYSSFRSRYSGINQALWAAYRENRITKKELNFHRFYDTLCTFGVDNKELGQKMADEFILGISSKVYLFDGAIDLLQYLKSKYQLHVITNGFEEVQYNSLRNSGLNKYFTTITTSEAAGFKKPDAGIFEFALKQAGAQPSVSLMIGDDMLVDMQGAAGAGLSCLLITHGNTMPDVKVDFKVETLSQISEIL
jgi:putative hydrolase of the HAD superfamily